MTDFSGSLAARMRKVTIVLALLACSAALNAAKSVAATTPGAALIFASVDMAKVIAGYSKRATAEATFQAIQQQYQDVFKTQSANAMLDEQDQQQLGTLLLLADSATADQKQQIADLETKSSAASDQLATLQQKKDPTDSDNIQIQQLTQQQAAGKQALSDVGDSYQQKLDQQNQQLSAQIADDIRVAVAAVAKQDGISVVFDSSVAIYASVDLTQTVITKLGGAK
jgi:Skp family chaperone for outer membrane proteins